MVKKHYPFLISVPHGGTEVPETVRPRLLLDNADLCYYCDPCTRRIFGFEDRVAAYLDTPISRMVVDLNRPPLPLPLRDPDGIIKVKTIDGKNVYRPGLIDRQPVRIAFDCHSMLPHGSADQKDAGKSRPLICLGNNGDRLGRARKGSIATCPVELITTLSDMFKEEFSFDREVAINNPFSGGFIANAHFWHKGIPWIQIEINRSLYEPDSSSVHAPTETDDRVIQLREKIWNVLTTFWNRVQ
jgi:N-formylglutamate deformylase